MNFKRFTVLIIAVVFSSLCVRADSDSTQTMLEFQHRLYDIFDTNSSAIVKVSARKVFKDGFRLDSGSGFVITQEGYVLTSAFITYKSDKIWVEWNSIVFESELIGYDPLTTLAVIKIIGDFKSKNPKVVSIDKNFEIPKVGTMVFAISREMGLSASPRFGLVAGHDMKLGNIFLPTVYIRTTIPSYNGSIGGALFDFSGKFIGMMVASMPEVGGSFVIPSRAIERIRDDIILCSEVSYSWFGIGTEEKDTEEGRVVHVSMVAEKGPAKKAGFKVGDAILEINSKKISNNVELRSSTFFMRPGETAKFKILREGKVLKLDVLIERMDPEIVRAASSSLEPSLPEKHKANEIEENKDLDREESGNE